MIDSKTYQKGPSIKYVRSKGREGSGQKHTSIVFMTLFYCLKAYKGGGDV